MTLVALFVLSLIAAVFFNMKYRKSFLDESSHRKVSGKWIVAGVNAILGVLAIAALLGTSVVIPSGDQIIVLDRIYLCSSIQNNRVIALPGECGKQAEILMPGFKFMPFVRVLNDVTPINVIKIPEGSYARLTARDGVPLEPGQVAAHPWPLGMQKFMNSEGKEVEGNMLNAVFFLTEGMGNKGPQTTILLPGNYFVNPHLWDVELEGPALKRTTVEQGFVGVVKSAIDEVTVPAFFRGHGAKADCGKGAAEDRNLGQIKAVLVNVGCRGVWKEPLPPGSYFVNSKIYSVTMVDTRVQNWTYKGGYTRRVIDLTVGNDGTVKQESSEEKVDQPKDVAGDAIAVKVEGWTVHQELRIQARVNPEDSSLVVAAVGSTKEIEDRIITPQVRSVLRNIGGSRITVKNNAAHEEATSELDALKARHSLLADTSTDVGLSVEQRVQEAEQLAKRIAGFQLPDPNQEITRPTRVLDFQNERSALETLVAQDIQRIGKEAGIEIVSVAFGNTDLPPELLVARKVEQLSGQLRNAYTQMRTAQVQRQASEAAKARADQQKELVTAQINLDISKIGIQKKSNDGLAERAFLEAQAKGQEAQANVLGKDRVTQLKAIELVLKTLSEKPELLTGLRLPSTMVFGQGGLEGPAAILGGSNLFGGPKSDEQTPAKK